MCFDQLSGAAHTQKLVETLFSAVFKLFGSIFTVKSLNEVKNEQKSLKTAEKKCFEQLSGARSTRKLVEIHHKQLQEMAVLNGLMLFIDL